MTRIVAELAERGHRIDVVTSLPWYRAHRVETGWAGRLARTERAAWGTIRRLHPFPGGDKRDLVRRVLGFLGFSALAGWAGLGAGGWFRRRRRGDRDVATTHDGRHRTPRRLVPPRAAGLQHPGRVPRRRRHHRRDHQPRRDRRRPPARTAQLPPRRRGHRPVRRPARQRRHQVAERPGRRRADDPQLRRYRAHPTHRPDDALPGRARPRRRAGVAVRRQRRLLPVRRTARPSRAPLARDQRRDQRRRCGPGRRAPIRGRAHQRPLRPVPARRAPR